MNLDRIAPPRSAQRKRRQSPLQRMDEFLEQNSRSSNAENIRLMREALFADVDELEKSGEVIIPK